MPKVNFVKKARKDNPAVKKGESYYWWSFRFGGKHYSKTPPRPSQLTQSEFLSRWFGLQERVADGVFWEIGEWIEAIMETVVELRDMAQESLDNMPEQLQYSETGERLQQRVEMMEEVEYNLDAIEVDHDLSEMEQGEIEDLIDDMYTEVCEAIQVDVE